MQGKSPDALRDEIVQVLLRTYFTGLSISKKFCTLFGLPHASVSIRKSVLPHDVSDAGLNYAIIEDFNEIASSAVSIHDPLKDVLSNLRSGRYSSICSFWPEAWHADLKKVGIKTINIDHSLYTMLNNKIHQADIIDSHGSELLRESLQSKRKILQTRYCLPIASSYFALREELGDFVVAASNSAGGSGMFLVEDMSDFLTAISNTKSPVVRVEKFIRSISLTQLGIVFLDNTVVYPLEIQYIKRNGNKLGYAGATSDINLLADTNVAERATIITRAVGDALAKLGYLGAFGCDLVYDPTTDQVLFIELNPRFVAETFLISEQTASAEFFGDLEQRFLFEPHFLHVCAHVISTCPKEVVQQLGSDGVIPVPRKTEDGYTTMLPLSVHTHSLARQNDTANITTDHRVCILFKDSVVDDPVVPTRFLPPVEELWTTIQSEPSPA